MEKQKNKTIDKLKQRFVSFRDEIKKNRLERKPKFILIKELEKLNKKYKSYSDHLKIDAKQCEAEGNEPLASWYAGEANAYEDSALDVLALAEMFKLN